MITIYHNPKCSKSRQGIEFLKKKGQEFKIINYIKEGISKKDLREIISLLKIKPIELVRTNESIWKELYKGKDLSDEDIITAMTENLKLMERPIIINGNKAVLGRPTENINEVI